MDISLVRSAMSGRIPGSFQIEEVEKEAAGGNTAAHLAAKSGHEYFLKELLSKCPSLVSRTNSNGDTPLHCASRLGKFSCMEVLLAKLREVSSDIGTFDNAIRMGNKRGNTILHESIRGRHEKIVSALLRQDKELVNVGNGVGESPIYLASDLGLVDMVKILLGCSPRNFGGPGGRTALHAAVSRGNVGQEVAQLLIEHKEDLGSERDDSGSTALHYVSSIGDIKMVRLLLEKNPLLALVCDNDGLSALHVAATMGHVHVINEILRTRPDTAELYDCKGRNFLHVAVEHKMKMVIEYVLRTSILQELLNMQDNEGNTPLHVAVIKGSREILQMLLEDERVDKNITNDKGKTPLDRASTIVQTNMELRKHQIMADLLRHGSHYSPKRFDLATPNQRRDDEDETRRSRDIVQNLAITSVLIATVTFAAAFTLPGGYNQDPSSPYFGTAVLVRKAAFQAFLISDALAMASSVVITFLLIQTGSWDHDIRSYSIRLAMKLSWLAIGGMVVAFATGTYVAIAPRCLWLAVVLISFSCCVPLAIYGLNSYPSQARGSRVSRWIRSNTFEYKPGTEGALFFASPLSNNTPPSELSNNTPQFRLKPSEYLFGLKPSEYLFGLKPSEYLFGLKPSSTA